MDDSQDKDRFFSCPVNDTVVFVKQMPVFCIEKLIFRYEWISFRGRFKGDDFYLKLTYKILGIFDAVISNVIKNVFQVILRLLRQINLICFCHA